MESVSTTAAFVTPPAQAAWQHKDARAGFEVTFFHAHDGRLQFTGHTSAVEEGAAWAVGYTIDLDARWHTRAAQVWTRTIQGARQVRVESDGAGRWRVDGRPVPALDGCHDVDLESSAFTNAFPVHRVDLRVGEIASMPAAYVRAVDLTVERLEQIYRRLPDDDDGHRRFHYQSPAFAFECELVYDAAGLVLAYPGIAVRAA